MNTSTKLCSLTLLPLIGAASLQAAPRVERANPQTCNHSLAIRHVTEVRDGGLQGAIEIYLDHANPGTWAFLVVGPGSVPIPLPGGDTLCVTPEALIPLGPMDLGSARMLVPTNLVGSFYMQALSFNTLAGTLELYTSEPLFFDNDHGDEVDPGKIDAGDEVDTGKIDAGDEVDTGKIDAGDEVDTGKIDAGDEVDTGKIDAGDEVDTGKIDAGDEVDTAKIDAADEVDTQKLDSAGDQAEGQPKDSADPGQGMQGEPGQAGGADGAQR